MMKKVEPQKIPTGFPFANLTNKLEIINMHMPLGTTLKIKGNTDYLDDWMEINLGQSADKLNLHFKLRAKDSIMVINSKDGGSREEQPADLPRCILEPEATFEITYETDQFIVKLPDRYEVTFPNRLGCNPLRYLSTKGNFRVSSVTFD